MNLELGLDVASFHLGDLKADQAGEAPQREARNAVAHPSRGGDDDAWDETITTSAKMAVGLWRVSKQGRRKALPGEISREW